MKHNMNKFNLSLFENLIKVLVNGKKLNVFFPASVILNSSITPPKCDFFDVYFFLWTYNFSIYLLLGDKWEESSPDW